MLQAVQARIIKACERAGRNPDDITLVAVTKGHDSDEIKRLLIDNHQRICAENRVQEWQGKYAELNDVEWHFIGNLQRNKVKYCLPFTLIHSLNSQRLADALQKHGEKHEHVFNVLVEVNVAGEDSKAGADLNDATQLVRYAQALTHVNVQGLMTMAPYSDNPEDARPYFKKLRELRDTLGLQDLSMGMSGDFEVAIEEGATLVRVGSALFQ